MVACTLAKLTTLTQFALSPVAPSRIRVIHRYLSLPLRETASAKLGAHFTQIWGTGERLKLATEVNLVCPHPDLDPCQGRGTGLQLWRRGMG